MYRIYLHRSSEDDSKFKGEDGTDVAIIDGPIPIGLPFAQVTTGSRGKVADDIEGGELCMCELLCVCELFVCELPLLLLVLVLVLVRVLILVLVGPSVDCGVGVVEGV